VGFPGISWDFKSLSFELVSDNIWNVLKYLVVSGSVLKHYQCIRVSDNVWIHLTLSDCTSQCLTSSDNIYSVYHYVAISDSHWQSLTLPVSICQYLSVSVSICQSCLYLFSSMWHHPPHHTLHRQKSPENYRHCHTVSNSYQQWLTVTWVVSVTHSVYQCLVMSEIDWLPKLYLCNIYSECQ